MSAKLAPRMVTMLKRCCHGAWQTRGNGPQDKRCKSCAHLVVKQWDKRYFKCDLNKDTGGPASDWRVTWPACGKYGERVEA